MLSPSWRFVVLPAFIETANTETRADSNDEAGAASAARLALEWLRETRAGSSDGAGAPCDTSFLAKRFKHRVPFEIGRTQTKDGGRIEIREVWGTRPQIEIGGQYLVRGKYALPRGERGMLYFYASAGGPWGRTASLDLQSTPVDEQEGDFALIHGMAGPGYFHLILTDAERYSRWFADVYFGNGDNVYRIEPTSHPQDQVTSTMRAFRTRSESSRARPAFSTATRSRSSKYEAPPTHLRRATSTGSKALTPWPRTIEPLWLYTPPRWMPRMPGARP